jgi:Skp family chaperone for outer membrane proteins
MLRCITVIAIAIAFWSSGASAARICAADFKAHCADVQPGEGRIRACVKEHVNDFSEACQARLAKLTAVAKPCVDDVKQKCGNVKRGRGRIAACLKSALPDLSDACKDAVTQAVAGAR